MEASLKEHARNIRVHVIRALTSAGSGHLGGSLGLADVFSVLYFKAMRHDPNNPGWEERDRLILSIGHVAPVLYAALAESGYFPAEEMLTLRKLGSRLQGHPGKDHGLPGVELSAGSLGQGLSVAVGLSLAARADQKTWRTYCVMGDGELQEGSVWEAAMSASHYNLSNLTAIVDRNFCQIDGRTEEVMKLEPLADKWKSFGWNVIACNGNEVSELCAAFDQTKAYAKGPTVILAGTLMGKGVPQIEDDYRWHGKAPTAEQAEEFLASLS